MQVFSPGSMGLAQRVKDQSAERIGEEAIGAPGSQVAWEPERSRFLGRSSRGPDWVLWVGVTGVELLGK